MVEGIPLQYLYHVIQRLTPSHKPRAELKDYFQIVFRQNSAEHPIVTFSEVDFLQPDSLYRGIEEETDSIYQVVDGRKYEIVYGLPELSLGLLHMNNLQLHEVDAAALLVKVM